MQKNTLRKGLVVGIMILFVGASVVPSISGDNSRIAKVEVGNGNAIKKEIPKRETVNILGDVFISSDNPNDDMHPKITRKEETLVVAYEKVESPSEQTIQVVYSQDDGQTWIPKFNFNSKDSPNGSGILQSPDIKYAPVADEFFLTMIDPLAEINNLQLVWIPSNIATTEDTKWWSTYGPFASNYEAAACTYVEQWFLSLFTEDVEDNVDWAPGLHIKALGLILLHP